MGSFELVSALLWQVPIHPLDVGALQVPSQYHVAHAFLLSVLFWAIDVCSQLFRLYLRSPLGKPMGPLEIPYPIGFLIPHWKSNPPRNPMGYRNSNGYQGLCVPLEFPYPIGIPSTLWITTLVHWKSNGCFIHLLWTDRGMNIVKLI